MQQGQFKVKNGRVGYEKYGDGKILLIAFHGHAERGAVFGTLEQALADTYTVYAIDFPFHGNTVWKLDTFQTDDIEEIIENICTEEGKSTFVAMGYSFGARVWQVLYPTYQKRIQRLIFIAPDGFRSQGMRTIGLVPLWFRRFLHRRLDKPEWFVQLVLFLRKLRIISQFRTDYLLMNLANERRVERAFGMWTSLPYFPKNLPFFEKKLKESAIPFDVYLGENDKIIDERPVLKLAENIPTMRVFFVEGTHRLFGDALIEALVSNDEKIKR